MITQFRGDYAFLSNFQYFEKPMLWRGIPYPSVEHFYIAMKTLSAEQKQLIANHPSKGLKAFGRTLLLREDWDEIKDQVMMTALNYKFSETNPTLRLKLIATGDVEIQEGNWWNDKYWGVCLKTGVGENKLGKMLMQIRGDIRMVKLNEQLL